MYTYHQIGLLVLLLLALEGRAIAQDKLLRNRPSGTIIGTVRDSRSGEALIGANVELKATEFAASTDLEGKYIIDGIPEGEYSLSASYIGYRRTLKPRIRVVAGESTLVNFSLRELSTFLGHVSREISAIQLDPELAEKHSLFWRPIGPSGKTVLSFAIGPDGQLYAGSYGGEVYLSSGSLSSWHKILIGLTHDPVGALAVKPNGDILAGTYFNGHLILTPDPIGIFITTDKGDSWHQILSSIWINSIKVTTGGNIYVCSNTFDLVSEFFCSRDGGKTWDNNAIGMPIHATQMTIDASGEVFLSAFKKGVYAYSDSSWHQVSAFVDTAVYDLSFHPSGDLFVATDVAGVLRSKDRGKHWTSVNNGLSDLNTKVLAVASNGHILVATESSGIYRSTDLGDSWLPMGPELTADIRTLVVDPRGYVYAGTKDYGVFKSARPLF